MGIGLGVELESDGGKGMKKGRGEEGGNLQVCTYLSFLKPFPNLLGKG